MEGEDEPCAVAEPKGSVTWVMNADGHEHHLIFIRLQPVSKNKSFDMRHLDLMAQG